MVHYVWEIGGLVVRCHGGLVPLRSSLKPSNRKSSLGLCFLLLSPPVIWAVFVRAALSLSSSLLSCAVLWTLSSAADHRVPTWIIWTRMKITVVDVRRDGIPWRTAGSRWGTVTEVGSKKRLRNSHSYHHRILLYHPCCLAAAVLAFKGQSTQDNKVFISYICSL